MGEATIGGGHPANVCLHVASSSSHPHPDLLCGTAAFSKAPQGCRDLKIHTNSGRQTRPPPSLRGWGNATLASGPLRVWSGLRVGSLEGE